MGDAEKKENMQCYQYLEKYRSICEKIDHTENRIQELRANMGSIGSPRIDGMPRGGGGDHTSKVEREVLRIQSQEERLERLQEREQDLYWPLVDILEKLPNPKHETLLSMRYLDGQPWQRIVFVVYAKELDEELADDAALIQRYTKRIFKDHGRALASLEAIWTDEWEGEELEAY